MERREFLKKSAIVIGGVATGVIWKSESLKQKEAEREELQKLREELDQIRKQNEANLLGDCRVENGLNEIYGMPPVNLEDCINIREKLWQEWQETKDILRGDLT